MSTAALTALPQLRPVSLDEYDQIVRLESANAMYSMPRDEWRNLWLENPLWPRVGNDWPIGWALENDEGRLVGSLVNIPSLYKFRGQQLICANGRGWVVDSEYRSFALALMGEYFGQPNADLFINTTVGPNAEPMIAALSDRIPRGDFETSAYFAVVYHELAAKALRRKHVPLAHLWAYPAAAALRLKDAWRLRSLPAAPASVVLDCTKQFDERFDAFWAELARRKSETLLAVRDRRALAWHFASSLRRGDLWILTASRNGLLQAYAILKRQDSGPGVSRLRLVDFQSLDAESDLLSAMLRPALRCCVDAGVQVLEHLGCDLPNTAGFEQFAPYRRKQACWPFYYRAVDPALDAELARPEVWEPSVFDGDAALD